MKAFVMDSADILLEKIRGRSETRNREFSGALSLAERACEHGDRCQSSLDPARSELRWVDMRFIEMQSAGPKVVAIVKLCRLRGGCEEGLACL